MVRSDLLRAKSIHAEVAYLRDLQRVGDAKRFEEKQNSILRDKERRFWSETIKARPANTAQPSASPALPPNTLKQVTAQLERMRQAHSQLSQAHRTHEHAASQLNEGLATLSTSQKRIEILEKLITKAQRIRANQVESRLSEEVADLVTTSKTVMNLRASLGGEVEPRDKVLPQEFVSEVGSPLDRTSTIQQRQIHDPSNLIPISRNMLPPPHGLQLSPTPTPTISLLGPASIGSVAISDVSFSKTHKEPTLSLTCALGAHGTMGLKVIKAQCGGGVKVLIDPLSSGVAPGVLREKGAIQSRLQAMGIKVSGIEIGIGGDDAPFTRGAKRSRLHEDEDEGHIS